MKVGYTADEIFEIAEDMELEGAAYYRHLAEHAGDVDMKELLAALAGEEKKHASMIRDMREKLVGNDDESLLLHPDEAVSVYLKTIVHGTVYTAGKDDTPKDRSSLIDVAIGKELDSILYYCAMRELAADKQAEEALHAIMHEERGHVVKLSSMRCDD